MASRSKLDICGIVKDDFLASLRSLSIEGEIALLCTRSRTCGMRSEANLAQTSIVLGYVGIGNSGKIMAMTLM